MELKQMTRLALLVALMLIFQSLRLLLPVPPFVSVFVIGSLVNACLLAAVETAGWRLALVPAVVAPVVAYMQQLLPLPVLIPPIAAANGAYALGYNVLSGRSRLWAVVLATGAKFAVVYLMVRGVLAHIQLPEKAAAILMMTLGWPQIITGLAGGILYLAIRRRLPGVLMVMLALIFLMAPAGAEPLTEASLATELCKAQTLENMQAGIYVIPEQTLNAYFSAIVGQNPKVKEATVHVLGGDKVVIDINAVDAGALRFTCKIRELHYDKDRALLKLHVERKELRGRSVASWFLNHLSVKLLTQIYGNPLAEADLNSKVSGNTVSIDLQPFATGLFKEGIGQSIGDRLVISKATTGPGVIYLHTNCAVTILGS